MLVSIEGLGSSSARDAILSREESPCGLHPREVFVSSFTDEGAIASEGRLKRHTKTSADMEQISKGKMDANT
jgi:hypothetical protein